MSYKLKSPKLKEKKSYGIEKEPKGKKSFYNYMIEVYEGQEGIKMSKSEKEDLWDNIYYNKKNNEWEIK